MFDKKIQKMVKDALASMIEQQEDEARYLERKAKHAMQSARLIRQLAPEMVKMFEPPKPFKPLTKSQLKKIKENRGSIAGLLLQPQK